MLKSIFIFLVSLIGVPLYAVCVVVLYVIGTAFGIPIPKRSHNSSELCVIPCNFAPVKKKSKYFPLNVYFLPPFGI